MKKILFTFLDFDKGGVPTSFSGIYESLKSEFDISVLPLREFGNCRYSFKDAFIPSSLLLRSCFNTYACVSGLEKLWLRLFRYCVAILRIFKIDIERIIFQRSIEKIENEYDFDLIVSFQDRITANFCQYFKTDKIAWIHYDYAKWNSMYKNDDVFLSKFRKIVCVSKYTMSTLVSKYPTLKAKTIYIYNLYDKNRIISLAEERPIDNRFDNNSFTIITVGRIVKGKRVENIANIASSLRQKGCRFRWYIIGSGANEIEAEINKTIEQYNVSEHVIMLGFKSNPYSYLVKSNLLVSLSESEACPMIFNEARILNIPVVTTNFGSAYEFVEDGVDGSISSIEKIDEAIFNLISDEATYNRYLLAGTNRVIDNDVQKHQIINVINSI